MSLRSLCVVALLAMPLAATACSDSDPANNVVAVDSGSQDTSLDSATDTALAVDTGVMEETSVDTGSTAPDTDVLSDALDDAALSETDAADSGTCTTGRVEEEACGKCGKRSRLCEMGRWLDWGSCGDESGLCVPGDTRDVACERCGTRKQTCTTTCTWSVGACLDQKGCVAGTTETRYGLCLNPTSAQTRTCGDTCSWTAWSECL